MSKVVELRKSELRVAADELVEFKPDCWILIGINDEKNKVLVRGPKMFDAITMYGMIEYAKGDIEASCYTGGAA